jgi:hypothetical protein
MRYKFLFCLVAILVFVGGLTALASSGPKSSISKTERRHQVLERVPEATFNVTIYNQGQGKPGPTILGGPWTNVVPTIDNLGTVTLDLSPPADIAPGGVVWIAAWANLDSDQGHWYWNDNSVRHGGTGQWRNPGGGFGTTCSDWGSIASCLGDPNGGPDLRFQIWGRPIGQPGDPILLYSQVDGTSDSAWIAQNFETAMDSYDCELADCWGASAPGWTVSRVVLEGTYVEPGVPCEEIFFFNAKCNANGAAQAMVKAMGDHSGKMVTFDLDGSPQVVSVMSNGTNSIAKMTVPHAGMGSHTVTLTDPSGCYSPVTFNCQVDAPPDPEWDAIWAEYQTMEQARTAVPSEVRIIGNYPNPFNPVTTISYVLPVNTHVTLTISDVVGREVARLVDGSEGAGYKSVTFDGSNLASGIYFYRLQAGSFVETKRMILMK